MRIAKAKPCPFCGSRSGFVERMELDAWQYVCNDCFTHGPQIESGDLEDEDMDEKAQARAIRAWNQRKRPYSPAAAQKGDEP